MTGLALPNSCLHIYPINSGRFGSFGCYAKSTHTNKAEPLIHRGVFSLVSPRPMRPQTIKSPAEAAVPVSTGWRRPMLTYMFGSSQLGGARGPAQAPDRNDVSKFGVLSTEDPVLLASCAVIHWG